MNKKLFEDIWWTFLIPLICLFSFSTNLINIVVLHKLKTLNINYKCMLIKSFINSIYLFITFFIFSIRCGQFCHYLKDSYYIKVYQLYFLFYLTSSLGLLDLFIELIISCNRFFTIMNKATIGRKKNINITIFILFLLSLIINSPHLIVYSIKIKQNVTIPLSDRNISIHFNNMNRYELTVESNYHSLSNIFFNFVLIFRGTLILLIILIVNILGFKRFKVNVNDLYTMKKNSNSRIIVIGNYLIFRF